MKPTHSDHVTADSKPSTSQSVGHNKREAAYGVGLPMSLLFYVARAPRIRVSTVASITLLHNLAPVGPGPRHSAADREVNARHSSDLWFVKVVCSVFLRPQYCLAAASVAFLTTHLTPSASFDVINRLSDPNLGLRFLEFSKVNFGLNHPFKTYNLLIRSLCEGGFYGSAKHAYDYMRNDGHLPTSSLIQFLVLWFSEAGKSDVLKGMLSQLQCEKIRVDIIVFNSLLNKLVKNNRLDEALCLFEGQFGLYCQPDTWTFNILVRGLCHVGEVDKAFEFFCSMGSFGCSPDTVTYNTLISGLCRVNEVDRANNLLKEVQVRKDLSPDVRTYTSVISGYCKLGKMQEASNLYSELISSGIKPSAVTFNVLIDGFGKAGDIVSVELMCKKMLSCGLLPDVVTYTSLIDGYCRNGKVNQGLKCWDEMNARKVSPNVYTFAVLINALCKESRLHEARQFLRELKGTDIIPKPFIYNPVIDGYYKAGNLNEANSVMAEMEETRCKPDKVTYTILIIGHCVKGRMLEAIDIFDQMLKIGCAPDNITVNSLVSSLLKAGMPNEAFRVRKTAKEYPNLGFQSFKIEMPAGRSNEIPVAV